MKSGNFSFTRSIQRLLVGASVIFLMVYFVFPSPLPEGRQKFSLSYHEFSGQADFELSGLGLGLTLNSKKELGLGLGLGEERSVSFDNWEVGPFLLGEFSPEGVKLDDFAGGLEANYFDYKIGGWSLSSTSRAWVGATGFRFGGTGSYSIGNLKLAYDLQVNHGFNGKDIWFPVRGGSYWTSLSRKSLSGFENVTGNYFTLYGERVIPLEDGDVKWSQGVKLDSQGTPGDFGLVTRLGYRDSFLLVEIDGLKIVGWALQFTGEKVSIGFLESTGDQKSYGVSVGYRGERKVGFEILESKDDPDMTLNLTVEW